MLYVGLFHSRRPHHGDFDFQIKELSNVGAALSSADAVTLTTLTHSLTPWTPSHRKNIIVKPNLFMVKKSIYSVSGLRGARLSRARLSTPIRVANDLNLEDNKITPFNEIGADDRGLEADVIDYVSTCERYQSRMDGKE